MRRTTTTLAALATGAALTLTTAAPALAARGVLTVSGKQYTDPARGCYTGGFRPLVVDNQTDTPVLVYADHACKRHSLGVVAPRQRRVFEFGGGVLVPS
ncbi:MULTISPECIES: hypothetical protein [Actinomadura]|uniref:Uncharacterized protein n=1 Tax=Actinomadura litoris TaxID=2678616 RepID=A0A7K1LEV7_9ACTN|nr:MULTISPECIES: hypothetical protein [Actinomadura]MBT2212704.1 hypothetical protein [Actinomadura sp. NEAU-AAG7]MUN42735.1 hypothetical protein [Actinomadura litoris]